MTEPTSSSLDPDDWDSERHQAHAMLDDLLDYVQNLTERPVWQPIPVSVRRSFQENSPCTGQSLEEIHQRFMEDILPYAVGNAHPGFMGWVHGGGTVTGMLAEMLAGGLNANLGGRDQIPVAVEQQIVRWAREWFRFPETAQGIFTTGTSQATLMALWVARVAQWGEKIRQEGVGLHTLTVYAASTVHGSLLKALDLSGLGEKSLHLVDLDESGRMDVSALHVQIGKDRQAGLTPFMVVGSAGTVDTGAIDDLTALATLCRTQSLWFHVDGALGALGCWSTELAPLFQGIEQADSLAFDFHKWGQVPYDAGFLLIRAGSLQRRTFASSDRYLAREERGTAAGEDWPCDLGPDLSRGFRALKTWMTVRRYGTERLGAMMAHTCALARFVAERVSREVSLELMAPVTLNIVCFRHRAEPAQANALNAQIAIALQESGIAVLSTTLVRGQRVLRVALVNHRTRVRDLESLICAVLHLGKRFSTGRIQSS
ncbi:pyridoxal-dependent decarboxylase [Ferrovum sp.]|uniref:pyridoxal phosphate-dependent decarboxylase family protein n=1 Tax=Ferrovum sp. TaxID=2609467 RepID=UPI00261098DD|nr:pyridoxal-dependent decarboxylase [Ferrovum sp.]